MSLRFAASHKGKRTFTASLFTAERHGRAANDNARPIGDLMSDPDVLRATLLHFARHGLAAAELARNQAEAAMRAGDEKTCRHWIAVCRQLDRRVATRLEGLLPSAMN